MLDYIGYTGPAIVFVLSLFLLYGKWIFFSYYIFGYFITFILNSVLKVIIKQPRPKEDNLLFNLHLTNGKRIGFDRYGMPSGHSQTVWYSLVFIFFALRSHKHFTKIITVYLIITLNTMIQRVQYKNHTVTQVIVGAFVGSFTGYFIYLMAKSKIHGLLRYKPDDNAFK
jgi:membrane-associated phospholipid phosphatase